MNIHVSPVRPSTITGNRVPPLENTVSQLITGHWHSVAQPVARRAAQNRHQNQHPRWHCESPAEPHAIQSPKFRVSPRANTRASTPTREIPRSPVLRPREIPCARSTRYSPRSHRKGPAPHDATVLGPRRRPHRPPGHPVENWSPDSRHHEQRHLPDIHVSSSVIVVLRSRVCRNGGPGHEW